MSALPLRCVVDTNVGTTANRANDGASTACVSASARALAAVMARGHVYIDDGWEILREYRANLTTKGQPREGAAFLRWILTNMNNPARVTRVPITRSAAREGHYDELPDGEQYDPSDRKFIAVAFAHPAHPTLLQSFDSKWWGWRTRLAKEGITIHFVCPSEIAKKYAKKMKR